MATHSSVLAWRIPGMQKPGGLPSMGSHRVRHDWNDLGVAAYMYLGGYLSGSVVKNPSAMQEVWIRSLGREDPMEEKMATHSSTLAWRIPWTEEPGQLQPIGSQKVGQDWNDLAYRHTYMYLFFLKFFPHLGYYGILSRAPCYSRSLIFEL